MRRDNIVELTRNSLVSNLTEPCRAWAKAKRGETDLAGTKYLQELVKESKQEIKET